MNTPRARRAPLMGVSLCLLLSGAGCAHQREAHYPPSDGVAAGPSKVWPWSRQARNAKPEEPALSAAARPRSDGDEADKFDYDYYRE